MTPAEVKAACDALPLSIKEIAERIGISTQSLRNVLSGQRDLGRSASILLDMLREENAKRPDFSGRN